MMAARRRSKLPVEEQTYRSAPVVRQTRFSTRRKTVHRQSHVSGIQLKKRQSTLTQLDFHRLPPSDGEENEEEVIVRDSEEETESESDEEIERPRKRRRTSTAPPSSTALRQSTMTQAFAHVPFPIDSDEDDVPGVELSSGDYTELSEREDMVKNNRLDEWVTIQSAQRNPEEHADMSLEAMPFLDFEGPPSYTYDILSSSPARPGRDGLASSIIPKTPKRFRVLEVPSSQTPPATPLSTQQTPRGFTQENSPLKRKGMSSQTRLRSTQKSHSQRSPLKEVCVNVHALQALEEKSPLKENGSDSKAIQISPQRSVVPESTLQDRSPPANNMIEQSPETLRKTATPAREAAIQTDEESPTKRRVREFNARYAALSRQGSGLRSKSTVEPAIRGKVIRSSTGVTSLHDDDIYANGVPQPVETQYPIGEETQAIMGDIDLARESVSTPADLNLRLEDETEEELPIPPRRRIRRSPSLHRQESNHAEEDRSTSNVESATGHEIIMESQIKEEQFSMFMDVGTVDFQIEHSLEQGRGEQQQKTRGAQTEEEEEERVPSSQKEQDQAQISRYSQVLFQETYIKEEQSRTARVIQDSQFDDIDEVNDDGSPDIQHNRAAESNHDPASEQLLRETQAFASRVSSSPPPAVRAASARQAPVAQMFPQPQIHPGPTQATTMDETQGNASCCTQTNLPGSPIRSTQSAKPLVSPRLFRNTPQRAARSILVPSSPVPLPPGNTSSSPIGARTPTTMRFLNRKPVTVSQLIPESLRDDGSIPQPPMWTQDEDEDEDDDEL